MTNSVHGWMIETAARDYAHERANREGVPMFVWRASEEGKLAVFYVRSEDEGPPPGSVLREKISPRGGKEVWA